TRANHLRRRNLARRLADRVDQQDEDADSKRILEEPGRLGLRLADGAPSTAGRYPACGGRNPSLDPRASERSSGHSASGAFLRGWGRPEARGRTTCYPTDEA